MKQNFNIQQKQEVTCTNFQPFLPFAAVEKHLQTFASFIKCIFLIFRLTLLISEKIFLSVLVSAKTFKMKKLFKIGLAVNSLFDNFQLTAAPAREIIVKICMACTDFSEISNIFLLISKKKQVNVILDPQ